jgi:hypothetical protein
MPAPNRAPSLRDLDIYRLVTLRRWKQRHVADSFDLQPGRVSQIVRRVRDWVDSSVGDWLFPGRDGDRFLAALDRHGIRFHQAADNPLNVIFDDPRRGIRYTRTSTASATLPGHATPSATPALAAAESANASAQVGANLGPHVSPQPRNFLERDGFRAGIPTPAWPTTSAAKSHS